jgi:glucan phosphoethanolaminetransferase (alkaline phosphatase superfamily)
MAALVQFGWSAIPDVGWLSHILAFIAIWTAGLFVVQARTLISSQDVSPRFALWAPRIRLLIDLCFTTAVAMLLPPMGLVVVSILVFFALTGLTGYSRYFLRPLSALTVYHNWREGAKASSHSVSTRFNGIVLIFGGLLIVMIALVLTAPGPGVGREVLWMIGGAALAGYLCLVGLASWLDPLDKILTTRGIGRLGLVRGYFVTWLAEFFYLGKRQVRESAIRQRQITSDALTPIETAIPIRRQLVIIQAESLDFKVLGHESGGQEVTPFLNRLRERSLFYRIAAARYIGSADADFVMLNGVMPSTHIITYNIPNYPYRNTLPQFLAQFGYRTAVFHGNTGNFYNRRAAFEKMGFAEVHFEEEMIEEGLPQIAWGIEDKQVLDYSARLLRQSTGPVCHFIITLTTHTPYTLLNGVEREIVANPQTMAHHYLNNMRYLDSRLRDYIASLGSATVLIYSDHPADPAVSPGFIPDCQGRRECVPCLIFDTESDLGALQRSREQGISNDGRLTLLDISSFLRAQVAAGNGQPHLAVHGSGGWQLTSDK